MRRIRFICYPDTDHPIGGVKQIYRQAELLKNHGFDACVVQQQQGFRPSWFESSADVIDVDAYIASGPNAENDLIVLPETWLKNVPSYLPGIPKVIFNQNAFYTFGLNGECNSDTLELYNHSDIQGVVCVSEDNRRLMVEGCGIDSRRCQVVLNGIDPTLFYAPLIKSRRIVFMGRKHADDVRKVVIMAQNNPDFSGYRFEELQRMTHAEVAEQLRNSLLYLSCGHPEGFGLPLAEAIACGCLVVGYHGLGGRDYAIPHIKSVEFGDLLGWLTNMRAELRRFETEPEAVIQERCLASRTIQAQFSLVRESERCLEVWGHYAIGS